MIPHTKWERLILLEEIERGEKVIRPSSLEHAEWMVKVAQTYINDHKQKMLDVLTKE